MINSNSYAIINPVVCNTYSVPSGNEIYTVARRLLIILVKIGAAAHPGGQSGDTAATAG